MDRKEEKRIHNVIASYLYELKVSGVKIVQHRSTLLMYKNYIDYEGLDFLKLSIAQAQDYQTYLTTKSDENGETHYSRVTVATIIDRVMRFYDFLKKQNLIHTNPFKEISHIKRAKNLPSERSAQRTTGSGKQGAATDGKRAGRTTGSDKQGGFRPSTSVSGGDLCRPGIRTGCQTARRLGNKT